MLVVEIAKLVLEYVKAVIWPAMFGLVIFRYRTEVRSLLSRMRSLSTVAGSAEFTEEVQEAREAAEGISEQSRGREISTEDSRVQNDRDSAVFATLRILAEDSPGAAVLGAWRVVELRMLETMNELGRATGGDHSLRTEMSARTNLATRRVIAFLADMGLSPNAADLLTSLRAARNRISHSPDVGSVTKEAARDFVDSCEIAVHEVQSLTASSSGANEGRR
jgi:hypothetical protein